MVQSKFKEQTNKTLDDEDLQKMMLKIIKKHLVLGIKLILELPHQMVEQL